MLSADAARLIEYAKRKGLRFVVVLDKYHNETSDFLCDFSYPFDTGIMGQMTTNYSRDNVCFIRLRDRMVEKQIDLIPELHKTLLKYTGQGLDYALAYSWHTDRGDIDYCTQFFEEARKAVPNIQTIAVIAHKGCEKSSPLAQIENGIPCLADNVDYLVTTRPVKVVSEPDEVGGTYKYEREEVIALGRAKAGATTTELSLHDSVLLLMGVENPVKHADHEDDRRTDAVTYVINQIVSSVLPENQPVAPAPKRKWRLFGNNHD